eukprot:s4532_g5.t1
MELERGKRTCRRRRAAQGNGRARGTLLTSLRVSKHNAQDGKKVAKAVLKPIERAMQPWIDGPRSVEYDYNIFTVGCRITDVCGTKATVVGVDQDGDLPVFTDDGKTMATWWHSIWLRTIGTVEGFDEDGDFKVKMSNGKPAVWYAHKCKQGIGSLPKKSLADALLEEEWQ